MDGRHPWLTAVAETSQQVRRGAAGLAKVATGVGLAELEVITARRDVCRGCEYATRSGDPRFAAQGGLTTFSRCTRCGCLIAAKTKLLQETCPLNRWI